jgi:hypothetical protein
MIKQIIYLVILVMMSGCSSLVLTPVATPTPEHVGNWQFQYTSSFKNQMLGTDDPSKQKEVRVDALISFEANVSGVLVGDGMFSRTAFVSTGPDCYNELKISGPVKVYGKYGDYVLLTSQDSGVGFSFSSTEPIEPITSWDLQADVYCEDKYLSTVNGTLGDYFGEGFATRAYGEFLVAQIQAAFLGITTDCAFPTQSGAISGSGKTACRLERGAMATNTPQSTLTDRPSPTSDSTRIARDEFANLLDLFVEQGYLESTQGEIVELQPSWEQWDEEGMHWVYDKVLSDFLFKAHYDWDFVEGNPQSIGCVIRFANQKTGEYTGEYQVYLDQSSIQFGMVNLNRWFPVDRTRGTGRVDFGNNTEIDFALLVNGQHAYVWVDEEIREYTLPTDLETEGRFMASQDDYGGICKMTNMMIWIPEKGE